MPIYTSSQQTCENLIRATGELAAERGFANVSTRAIAKRAKANLGSIHYHFGGKDGLFKAVVMRVLEYFHQEPIERILEPLQPIMDTPEGQVRAIQAIVRKFIRTVFDPDKPKWYSPVLYQVQQYDNPLRGMVFKELIEPDNTVVYAVLEKINPDLSVEEKTLYFLTMGSTIILHNNFKNSLLRTLGKEEFDAGYLKTLEEISVRNVVASLGLLDVLKSMGAGPAK